MADRRPIITTLTRECRHDGPIPPDDPGCGWPSGGAGRARLFQRLAGETRTAIARRRHRLSAAAAPGDGGLERIAGRLRLYRDQGVAWTSSASSCRQPAP